ncbi:MAG: helix-turn-helix domain-containing protein [Arthrobacter sp.]|uniref:PucR family transcriptional regulator n=1 Tax=Arthrobacter sp. EPSL27 TaxID=1745378 RepID=UPI000B1D64A8|nr:helix-turn-helix domain-containing protein [Arthrobacter sp. EPSL27]
MDGDEGSKMFDRLIAEEILSTAAQRASALPFCEVEDLYLGVNGQLRPTPDRTAKAQDQDVLRLHGRDAVLPESGRGWRYALFIFGDSGELNGCLVLSAPSAPGPPQLMQLRNLGGPTPAASPGDPTAGHPPEATGQLRYPDGSEDTEERLLSLSATVLKLEARARVQNALDRTMIADLGQRESREAFVAEVLSELTGRPICIEDAFGNIRAAAGIGPDRPYAQPGPGARARIAQLWLASGSPVREPRRLVALVLPDRDVLGAICMLETDKPFTDEDVFALEYARRILHVELAHRRSLAQVELRLGRDLVDELVAGMDQRAAVSRAQALGYDLGAPQHVIVAQWQPMTGGDSAVVALRKALGELRTASLVSQGSDMTIAVATGAPTGAVLFKVMSRLLHGASGAVGVGGPCQEVTQIPRSFAEAQRALHIRTHSIEPSGLTRFDQLGIYRILDTAGGQPDLAGYIDEWLGALQHTDDSRGSDLVHTLAQYLDHGGNYDSTAQSLTIHRSTLRYRLKSIRQITGFDLADPEIRLNLHVATRAWRLRPQTSSGTRPRAGMSSTDRRSPA